MKGRKKKASESSKTESRSFITHNKNIYYYLNLNVKSLLAFGYRTAKRRTGTGHQLGEHLAELAIIIARVKVPRRGGGQAAAWSARWC